MIKLIIHLLSTKLIEQIKSYCESELYERDPNYVH